MSPGSIGGVIVETSGSIGGVIVEGLVLFLQGKVPDIDGRGRG